MELFQYWWVLWIAAIPIGMFVTAILAMDDEKRRVWFPDSGPSEICFSGFGCLVFWIATGAVVALFRLFLPEPVFPVVVLVIFAGYASFLLWVFGFSFPRVRRGSYRRASAR